MNNQFSTFSSYDHRTCGNFNVWIANYTICHHLIKKNQNQLFLCLPICYLWIWAVFMEFHFMALLCIVYFSFVYCCVQIKANKIKLLNRSSTLTKYKLYYENLKMW
jgi:predicted membrane protein